MIDQQSTWGEVGVGDYVRDATGKVWKVEQADASWVYLLDRQGGKSRTSHPAPDRPVVKLVPSSDEQTVVLIEKRLGGEVTGVLPKGAAEWLVPELLELDQARHHVLDMHKIDCSEVNDLGRIAAIHEEAESIVPHSHRIPKQGDVNGSS